MLGLMVQGPLTLLLTMALHMASTTILRPCNVDTGFPGSKCSSNSFPKLLYGAASYADCQVLCDENKEHTHMHYPTQASTAAAGEGVGASLLAARWAAYTSALTNWPRTLGRVSARRCRLA